MSGVKLNSAMSDMDINLQFHKNSWQYNPHESHIFHHIHNGRWLGWNSCRGSQVSSVNYFPPEKRILGEDGTRQRDGNGSWKLGFCHV